MADELPLFVDPDTLYNISNYEDVQIVAVDSESDFVAGHIGGAHRIDLGLLVADQGPLHGLLPEPQVVADVCSSVGLRNNATIVAYDQVGDVRAARFLYTLDAMGHDHIALLDGGLSAWVHSGYELVDGESNPEPSHFSVARRDEAIADHNWIKSHLDNDNFAVLDVRSADEYAGRDVRSARGGHVPGAANLDWQQLKNADGRLKSQGEIEALLAERGIKPDQQIVTYCQSHMRSSYAYLVLKALGYDQVRGYPGAWSDWGNREDTPVETGDTPARG